MTNKPDGGAAFPTVDQGLIRGGMSLREYFAAHAPDVPPTVAFPPLYTSEVKIDNTRKVTQVAESELERTVRWRWEYADAMLAGRV